MAAVLYLLCTISAMSCCVLLLRGYRRTRVRLLLWGGLCFAALTVENLLLFLDRIVYPATDLASGRIWFPLLGVLVLVYGLIWKDK